MGVTVSATTVETAMANATVHENYCRALVRRFPYAVFYEYTGDTITVYCVFHTSRDPAIWQGRT